MIVDLLVVLTQVCFKLLELYHFGKISLSDFLLFLMKVCLEVYVDFKPFRLVTHNLNDFLQRFLEIKLDIPFLERVLFDALHILHISAREND